MVPSLILKKDNQHYLLLYLGQSHGCGLKDSYNLIELDTDDLTKLATVSNSWLVLTPLTRLGEATGYSPEIRLRSGHKVTLKPGLSGRYLLVFPPIENKVS